MTKRDSVIQKIRALLARAQHEDANPNEAAASLAKAQSLMAQYEIEEGEAYAGEKPKVNETFVGYVSTRVQTWETTLADAIGRLFDCQVLSYPDQRKFGFIGTELNRELGIHAFEAVRNQLLVLLEVAKKHRPTYENPKAYRTSWLLGASVEIARRARELRLRREAEADEQSRQATSALMVLKGTEVNEFLRAHHPNVTERQVDVSYASVMGLRGGISAAGSIDLDRSGLTGSQQRRLG